MALSRSWMPSTSTLRRYLGHHTTWYLQENTPLWFDRRSVPLFALCAVWLPNATVKRPDGNG